MKLRSRKGFTMIELIIVIVILGILAAIAIVGYQAVVSNAKQEAVNTAAKSFDHEYRALAAFANGDSAGTMVNAAAVDTGSTVTLLASNGDASGGVTPGTAFGTTNVTESNTPAKVQFTKDGKSACLTLSAAPQTPGTVLGAVCATW